MTHCRMSQTSRIPGHLVFSSYSNGAPEEETYSNLQAISDTTQQMEFNIRYHAALIILKSPFQETFISQIIIANTTGNGIDASVDNL